MSSFLLRLVAYLSLILFLSPVFAQETPPPQESSAVVAPVASPFPGGSEVIPRLSDLVEKASAVAATIKTVREPEPFNTQLIQVEEQQQVLLKRIKELGEPSSWAVERLLDVRGPLLERRNSLVKLLDATSKKLQQLEAIRQEWDQIRQFWKDWEKALETSGPEVPAEAFTRARELIKGIEEDLSVAFGPLIELQTKVTQVKEKNLENINTVDTALSALKRETFKRTSPSFLRPAFYHQFDAELMEAFRHGIDTVEPLTQEYLASQIWLLGLQLGLALLLGSVIRKYRRGPDVAEEWWFILNHPWATSIFVSVASLSPLYSSPPALWRFCLWGLAAGSGTLLVAGMLQNRRKIFIVFLLGTWVILSMALQTFSIPQPLYRVYLAMLSLSGIPVFISVAFLQRRAKDGKVDAFVVALRIGCLILLSSFAAQCAGYANLASRLIDASLETVFLWICASMMIRLVRGGVEYIFGLVWLKKSRFIRRFGDELGGRLKALVDFCVVFYSGLYLLMVWRVFDSVPEAWDYLMQLQGSWGDLVLSLESVLYAGLVLYLSIVVSWILRSLLETELFPRKGLERGVRDSIKMLLHYSLILIGFLMAMGVAGFELKNFAVLAGAFGIGIGFGLQNVVNNFVSGLILLFERPIKVGDMVVLDGEWGSVRKIGLRSTVVLTLDQAEIIVPNSDLVAQKVTNWTLSNKMARVVLPVGVAYGSDVEKVLEVLLGCARDVPGILTEPPASAIFTGFGESSLDFELRIWIEDIATRLSVRSNLGCFIDKRFRQESIEIPFPQRDLHLRSVDEKLLRRSLRASRGRAKQEKDS